MAINTDTWLEIKGEFDSAIGDFLEVDTTTNITTSNAVVSTTLRQYDNGTDGYFDKFWVEITEGNNAEAKRRTGLPAATTYATATGTLTVAGDSFAADTGDITCRLHKYNPSSKERALIEAIKQIYPMLHKDVDDITLITGNILPDGHFESWTSSSVLDFYTAGTDSGTFAQTSTAGQTRGGTYSAKYTAGGAAGYFYISSSTYPRLLELQGQTVNFYVQAYPQTADDATISIITIEPDSTTTTTASTTTCPAGRFTLLENESVVIPAVCDEIQIAFNVATSGQYVVFDDAFLSGQRLSEYLLPPDFINGELLEVKVQDVGYLDPPCYDLHPFTTEYSGTKVPFEVISDGTNRFLKLVDSEISGFRMRLRGDKVLEIPTAYTSTITIDPENIPLLIAKARVIFWQREAVPANVQDIAKFRTLQAEAEMDYRRLLATKRMTRPSPMLK